MSYEAPAHVPSFGVEGDYSFVSLWVLVYEAIGFNRELKLQVNVINGNVFHAQKEFWININIKASFEVLVITTNLSASRATISEGHQALVRLCA